MKHAVMQALLRLARRILESVVAEIASQMKIVQEVAEQITGSFIPMLDSWIGPDKDAFQDMVLREIIPLVVALVGALLGIQTGINSAIDRIDQADKKCVGHVNDLSSQFRSIMQ
jgi:hypothetical protein